MAQTYIYTLKEDFHYSTSMIAPTAFKSWWLTITPGPFGGTTIKIRKAYSWDGYSLVPDLESEKPSCVHDAIYQLAEVIAKAWNWTVRKVLAWADEVFYEMMLCFKVPPGTAKLYYRGVRMFGYAYHQVARTFRWLTGRKFEQRLERKD